MVKVHKRASKRVGTKQRSKIQKKVREHHRKSKRDAKKDKTWKSKKRQDPGIPNSYPYKEQLLNEIEERRRLAEEQRILAREARQAGVEETEVEGDIIGSEDDDEVADGGEKAVETIAGATTSAMAAPAQFSGNLDDFLGALRKDSDPCIKAVVLLLDARDPKSWRIPSLEETIRARSEGAAELIVALTRADLLPLETLATWTAVIAKMFSSTVYPVCSPAPAAHGNPAREGAGVAALVACIEDILAKDTRKGTNDDAAAIALVGLENSGRTSLANILASSMPKTKVFDTPFVVQASSSLANNSASHEESDEEDEEDDEEMSQRRDDDAAHRILIRNSGHVFKIREPLPLMHALMRRVAHPADLMMAYNTPAFGSFVPRVSEEEQRPSWKIQMEKLEKDAEEFLIAVANKNGRMMKGKMPDPFAAARIVLRDWSMGTLGYYVKPTSEQVEKSAIDAAQTQIKTDSGLKKLVLPRKEWRKKYEGKELRLNDILHNDGLLGKQRIAFAKVSGAPVVQTDKTLDDDDEEEEEEEDASDEEMEEEDDVDVDEDDEDENEAVEEQEVEEEEQELAIPSPKSILKASRHGRASKAAATGPVTKGPASRKAKRKVAKGTDTTAATLPKRSSAKRVRF